MKKLKKFISLVAAAALLVMVPGGNAAANPGSDPRLYMPPTGIKRPAVNPNPSHTRPNKTHK